MLFNLNHYKQSYDIGRLGSPVARRCTHRVVVRASTVVGTSDEPHMLSSNYNGDYVVIRGIPEWSGDHQALHHPPPLYSISSSTNPGRLHQHDVYCESGRQVIHIPTGPRKLLLKFYTIYTFSIPWDTNFELQNSALTIINYKYKRIYLYLPYSKVRHHITTTWKWIWKCRQFTGTHSKECHCIICRC